jgi:16S rRNA C1402 N4-methylase RsmH
VKNFFKNHPLWRNLSKHPTQATYQQKRENPRARSAKLRAAERIESNEASSRPFSSSA